MTAKRPVSKSQKRATENETPCEDLFSQRKRAVDARFRVLVDRQTKSSHATHALAAAEALQIKNAYPVVQVSIYDAEDGQTTRVERSEPA
jgi:hypothetical protein